MLNLNSQEALAPFTNVNDLTTFKHDQQRNPSDRILETEPTLFSVKICKFPTDHQS